MSAYEQRVEPPDRKWQYLLFAAEPYETIAFKVTLSNCLILTNKSFSPPGSKEPQLTARPSFSLAPSGRRPILGYFCRGGPVNIYILKPVEENPVYPSYLSVMDSIHTFSKHRTNRMVR